MFGLVNSTQSFTLWSPSTGRDPDIRLRFSGPDSGVGSRMDRASANRQIGTGSQEITLSVPPERVVSTFDVGDMGQATAMILLAPKGGGTRVIWSPDTDVGMNPVARWMGLAMDGMVGADDEAGLARLRSLAESG